MEDHPKIRSFIANTIYPNEKKFQDEEMLAYIFSTQFVEKFQDKILPRLRGFIKKLVSIMETYFITYKAVTDKNIYNVAIAELLSCADCKNTGAVKGDYTNIEGVIHDGNLREIFFVFDVYG